ncbi:DUF3243 domain-containing protein [Salimicrobium halophilum]|uniref:DUF3243 domain-containing protein n=1 Tax=Salimicrobium halophilum TaxID=86666 RepID=A0A1G8Q772_9BACI|nr:DUF3243 domain-containing protein [Salimicrobium halophilum]SDJ00659.1 Protein of unknown function [Salimicrobium halophilum]
MSVMDNFDSWKQFLGSRLNQAESKGLQEGAASELAYEIGDYLAGHVDPKNEEEATLRDLWNASNKEEQHAIANAMIKMVQNSNR